MLSIGTGRTTQSLEFKQVNRWGALGWASRIPDVFMGGQFQITADLCAQLIDSVNPNGYLRLQLAMNKQYEQREGQTVRLAKQEQVNAYTGEALDDAMDRADLSHIDNLIQATAQFLESDEDYCPFDGVNCSVDQSIEQFIEANR